MLNRRSFLIASGLTALASTRVMGANDTIRVGVIGAGARMRGLLDAAEKAGPYQIVAVSDVYSPHRDAVKERSERRSDHDPPGLPGSDRARRRCDYSSRRRTTGTCAWRWTRWRRAKTSISKSRSPTPSRKEPTLTRAVRSGKQILQCGMQQRSWAHFRDAVDLIQGGSLGRIPQVRTYWWQNYRRNWPTKPIDRRHSIGSFGWEPRRISNSARRNSITGAGTGILAAAR